MSAGALDIDRLDRLTAIVDRTRLTLGQAAARQLWPMLGLPDLRTSDQRKAPEEPVPDLLSGLEGTAPITPSRSMTGWVALFIEERCILTEGAEVQAVTFREAYERWAKAKKAPLFPQHVIGKYVAKLGVGIRKSNGSFYLGLRLREPED